MNKLAPAILFAKKAHKILRRSDQAGFIPFGRPLIAVTAE